MNYLSDTAKALTLIVFGWTAFFVTMCKAEDKLPIPVSEAPGWHVARDGFKTYDVQVLPNGWGVIRDQQTGSITTFDTNNGTWRNDQLESGTYK